MKSGKFQINNPKGKSSTATRKDTSNPLPGRKDGDASPNSTGLRGSESIRAYAKGRSYGK